MTRPLRILVISNLYPPESIGGYEERCRAVVDALRQRGHTILVLTSHVGLAEPAAEPDANRVWRALIPMGCFGFPWVRAPRLFTVERANHDLLRRAIQLHRPDVIHVWNLGGLGRSLLLTASEAAPLVTDISDHWVLRSRQSDPVLVWRNRRTTSDRISRAVLQRGIPRGDLKFGLAYFTSDALRRLTAASYPELVDAPVIHCGIRVEDFAAPPRARSPGILRCLYVGRLHPDKGVATACAAVVAAGEGVTLDLWGAGDPAYEQELRQRFGGESRIRFRGKAAPAQVPEVYRQGDCLIFPSEWDEPFALVPLEAAAAGLPIIGTTTGGSGEFLVDGVTALTYPAGDVGALAAGIQRLAIDAGLVRNLATQALATVRARFSFMVMVHRIESQLLASVHGMAAQ